MPIMYDGIMMQSPEFHSESPDDERRFRFVIACGSLVEDPVVSAVGPQQTPKVAFQIKYYTKKYLRIVAWGNNDNAILAQTLVKGDRVLCIGTTCRSKYTVKSGPRKGEVGEWYEMNCQWMCSMRWLADTMNVALSRNIQKIVESEGSDAMESLNDHTDEYGAQTQNTDLEYEDDYEMTI